jgi:hypothetical protein
LLTGGLFASPTMVAAWVLGDRDDATCQRLLDEIGMAGRQFITDDWEGYHRLIPEDQRRRCVVESPETYADGPVWRWPELRLTYGAPLVDLVAMGGICDVVAGRHTYSDLCLWRRASMAG